MSDTIFAVATAQGRAAIAVVRLSGPVAHEVAQRLAGPVEANRRLVLRRLRREGELIDEGLVACFPASSSPTGEPYAEFHVHGGRSVTDALLKALGDFPDCRAAGPGEFSRRSMVAGKMDLTQLEGVADLVSAETESQRRQALRLVDGEGSREVAGWRAQLVEIRALIEAGIDFSDQDLPGALEMQIAESLDRLLATLSAALAPAERAAALREGFEVVLAGPPNVGKSSLLNAMAGRRVALTSATPGTTRDMVETRLDLDGMAVTFVDTAGDRVAADPVEAEGVAMARARAASADLVLRVAAPDVVATPAPTSLRDILVWNKADVGPGPGLQVSATTGAGVDALMRLVGRRLSEATAGAGSLSRERHRAALKQAIAALESARTAPVELAAEDVRAAGEALDLLIGQIDAEDVLGEIFGRFCIGK